MDTSEHFEIISYSGCGNIKFGMTPAEVESELGAPDQVSENYLNQRVEFRSFMNVAYSNGDEPRLNHIGFGRQMEAVTYKELKLFKEDPFTVLKELARSDSHPYVYLGFVVFLDLGITLTGFHDEDESQKAIALFEKGAWDARIKKMKPFVIV